MNLIRKNLVRFLWISIVFLAALMAIASQRGLITNSGQQQLSGGGGGPLYGHIVDCTDSGGGGSTSFNASAAQLSLQAAGGLLQLQQHNSGKSSHFYLQIWKILQITWNFFAENVSRFAINAFQNIPCLINVISDYKIFKKLQKCLRKYILYLINF